MHLQVLQRLQYGTKGRDHPCPASKYSKRARRAVWPLTSEGIARRRMGQHNDRRMHHRPGGPCFLQCARDNCGCGLPDPSGYQWYPSRSDARSAATRLEASTASSPAPPSDCPEAPENRVCIQPIMVYTPNLFHSLSTTVVHAHAQRPPQRVVIMPKGDEKSNPSASNAALQTLLQYTDGARAAIQGYRRSLPLLDRNVVTVLPCCGLWLQGALHVER